MPDSEEFNKPKIELSRKIIMDGLKKIMSKHACLSTCLCRS